MNFLNKSQLAFILEIKVEDARAKMCVAWASAKGIENKAYRSDKNKIIDPYPLAMPIEILAKELNIPLLQEAVDDIHDNYLKRSASKKWILSDYPEKQIDKAGNAGKSKVYLSIPKALKALISETVQAEIKAEWQKRYENSFVTVV